MGSQYNWIVIERTEFSTTQILVIPPNNASISVDSKDRVEFCIVCDGNDKLLSEYVYVKIGHREQLLEYDNIGNVMETFYYSSDYVYSGYIIGIV